MTGRADRPCVACDGYDRTRGNVALAKLALALGVKLDATQPDHVLLERLADAIIKQRQEIIAQVAESEAQLRRGSMYE